MDPGSFLDTVWFEQNCFKKQNCSKTFVLLLPNFFFFVKDFQKPDAQVSDFEVLSHF